MTAIITDPAWVERIRQERQLTGADHRDEVWEGVYIMTPLPNNEHQEFVGSLTSVLTIAIGWPELGKVYPGINLSDRDEGWEHNYRAPDVVVFLQGTQARNCDTHWVGGPDFVVEITSPYDKTREKLPFYEQIGTRELLLLDRDPWQLELYRLQDQKLVLVGQSKPEEAAILSSAVLPLDFQLQAGTDRPKIVVQVRTSDRRWIV